MKTRSKSYCLVRCAGQQGMHPPGRNQPGIEKCSTGINSSEDDLPGNHNQDIPNPEPVVIPPNKPPKAKRTQWAKEEYRTVLRAVYTAQKNPITNLTEQTFIEWRKVVGNDVRENIDSNKLANVRRDVIRNKRLTDAEIDQIRTQIRNEENVTTDEKEEQHFIENMNLEPIVLIPQLRIELQNRIAEVRNASINDEDPKSQDNFTEKYSQEIEEAQLDILPEFSRTEHQDLERERDPLPKITNSAKLNLKIKLYNVALKKILTNKECGLSNLNAIIYATGKAISNQMGVKTKKKKNKHTNKHPKWKVKIQKEIDALQGELSILDEISKGTAVKTRKARKVRNRHNVTDENSLLTAKETLKQKIQVKAQRLHRYDKQNRFYWQNKIFKTDAKKFYREIGKGTINIEEPPVNKEMMKFWNDIWGKEKDLITRQNGLGVKRRG